MKKGFSFVLLLFILGGLAAGSVVYFAVKESYRSRTIQSEVDELKKEEQRIRQENELLREKISYFESKSFQERVAKERLNLKKEDENVIVINPEPRQDVEEVTDNSQKIAFEESSDSNYVKWWKFFFRY